MFEEPVTFNFILQTIFIILLLIAIGVFGVNYKTKQLHKEK
jgi:cell division protein FtsL